MPVTIKITDIVERIRSLIDANKVALGVSYVEKGESSLVPTFPAVQVQGRTKTREYSGTHRYKIEFTVDIVVLFEKVQSASTTSTALEPISEAVETLINNNRQLLDTGGANPIVIQGLVTRIEYGIARSRDGIRQAARIVYEGLSQETFA